MDFKTFKEIVIERLLMCLPEGAWAEDVEIVKQNRYTVSGISIIYPSRYMSPFFYLEPFFKMTRQDVRIGQIISDILMILKAAEPIEGEKTDTIKLDWENLRDKVYPRLMNYKKNQKLLSEIPHKRFLDLAVTYYIEIPVQNGVSGYMPVRMALFEMWGIGLQELQETALHNLQHHVVPNVISAYDLQKMAEANHMEINYMEEKEGGSDKIQRQESGNGHQEISDSEEMEKLKKEYILSMPKFSYGAEVLLCTDVIEGLAETLHADLYIIPLAVDAVQAVPVGEWISPEEIYEEIRTVESMKTESIDFLSEKLYLYRRNSTHRLELVSRNE